MKIKIIALLITIILSGRVFAINGFKINENQPWLDFNSTFYESLKVINDDLWKTCLCYYSTSEAQRIKEMLEKLKTLNIETKKINDFYSSKLQLAENNKDEKNISFLKANINDTNNFYLSLNTLKIELENFFTENNINSIINYNCDSPDTQNFLDNGNIFKFYNNIENINIKISEISQKIFNFSRTKIQVDNLSDLKYYYAQRTKFDLTNVELLNMNIILSKTLKEVREIINIVLSDN